MILSDKSIREINDSLENKCELIFAGLSEDPLEDWDRAERETIEYFEEILKDDFRKACNNWGFDWFPEFGKKGFKESLLLVIEEWEFK